jgi:cyclophilin family peptidyl-prolyl cis-trans isomerase
VLVATLLLDGVACAEESAVSSDPVVQSIDQFIAKAGIDRSKDQWKLRVPQPPKQTFAAGKKYYWVLTTNKGPVRIHLRPDIAPMHVTSTIYLTRLGFYDGTVFHRVIPGFMAQGGDPTGTGAGGPGYKYAGEFDPKVKHDRKGLLSMANAGPGTDGSQFFLTFVPTAWLDGKHTLFGEVVDGHKTLDALEAAGTPSGKPREPLLLQKAEIAVE